jgi:hypothetical protein
MDISETLDTLYGTAPEKPVSRFDALLQRELDRAERQGVVERFTKKPSKAMQFARKADAILVARKIGWPVSSPLRQEVLGFLVWVLGDPHMNFLTARGVLSLVSRA